MFAGIGGFRSGLSKFGDFFMPIGFCEIDPYARRAYEAIYDTKGELFFEDARKIVPEDLPDIDLICGGFPCQSFSIAGKRGGFEDARGTLFFEIARIARVKRPKYLLLENVPGLLSHDGGRTFATILGTLSELGYCAWAKKQGYRMYERQAKEIFALVQNSIPALPMTPSTTIVVMEAVRVVREIEASRTSILTQMQAFAKSLPEYSFIREMACVGDTLTPLVIAEIGDIRNFHSKHALIAYAGIDAPPYQSGGFYGTERHISKRGNGYLRHVGFEIMQCKLRLKPEGDPVYAFIQKKRAEGK